MPLDWSKYPGEFWHCYLRLKDWKAAEYRTVNDFTIQEVREQIVEPWHEQRPFTLSGVIVRSRDEVAEIRIVQTPQPLSYYEQWYSAEERRSGVVRLLYDTRNVPFWHDDRKDYTYELLLSAIPAAAASTAVPPEEPPVPPAAKAFIVHGHDQAALHQVARFLEQLDIEPVILTEQPHRGRALIEKLEQNRDVGYVVVLFTPDDVGRAKADTELKPRARQNVVLEFGYFAAHLARHKVCVLMGEGIEAPTDIDGVGYYPLDPGGAWKMSLAKEIKAAGLPIDMNKVI
jgi:predicted nucleotide-binding protein